MTPRPGTRHTDVDEIVRCEMIEVPEPKVVKVSPSECAGNSGTLVCWSQCDRLDNRRVSTIVRKLEVELGRRFRHFIWKGLRITINGDTLDAFDPLLPTPESRDFWCPTFGEEMRFEVRADPLDSRKTGWVSVRFRNCRSTRGTNFRTTRSAESASRRVPASQSSVEDERWLRLVLHGQQTPRELRRLVALRDPVRSDPRRSLGITHTKQQARPPGAPPHRGTRRISRRPRVPSMAAHARLIISREGARALLQAERIATSGTTSYALPRSVDPTARALMRELEESHPTLRDRPNEADRYSIIEHSVKDTSFFTLAHDGDRLVLVLNPDHPSTARSTSRSLRARPSRSATPRQTRTALRGGAGEAAARGKVPALAKHRLGE